MSWHSHSSFCPCDVRVTRVVYFQPRHPIPTEKISCHKQRIYIYCNIMEDDMNVSNGEPALDSGAGLTEQAAQAAGPTKGFADHELHAGFISKQTGLPPVSTTQGNVVQCHCEMAEGGVHISTESAVEDASGGEVYGGSGGTEGTAMAAGKVRGYVDHELHAGFVTKQTPM